MTNTNMTENLIISRGKIFRYNDNEKLYEFIVNHKGEEHYSPEYHNFFYSPSKKQFANRFSFYVSNQRLRKVSIFPERENVWHSSMYDMMLRYRTWVTDEDEFSGHILHLSSHDPNFQKQLRPILDDNYVDSVAKLWEDLDGNLKI